MVIKASDRLADILARDERVLDVMLATVPDLRGLRNPVTRRVMGKLTTIAQVARMAGIEPDILIRRINAAITKPLPAADDPMAAGRNEKAAAIPTNRRPQTDSDQEKAVSDTISTMPAFLAELSPDRLSDLDVRDDLRNGREPFSRIMAAKAALPPGGVLRLRATFEPVPLYAVLGKQGFEHWTEQFDAEDWRVWFYPRDLGATEVRPDPSAVASAVASDSQLASSAPLPGKEAEAPAPGTDDADIIVLDVRGLDPPEPMVLTLAELEKLPAGRTLLQINERIPQFLLPQLEGLGFVYDIREQTEGVVRVFIRRAQES